jgi:hypothetical protein
MEINKFHIINFTQFTNLTVEGNGSPILDSDIENDAHFCKIS